jgi:hypothetical protein
MLLEAYHLLKNRIGQGQSDSSAHESFSTSISKAFRTWRLILNSDGSIHGIEPMGDADAAGYWSLVQGTSAKEKRFPALRPKRPLLVLSLDDDRWKAIEDLKKGTLPEVKEILTCLAKDSQAGGACDLTDSWELKAAPILKWNAAPLDTELLAQLQSCVKAFGHFCGRDGNLKWEYSTKGESTSRERKLELKQRQLSESKTIATHLVRAFVNFLQSETDVNQIKAIAASLLGIRKKNKAKEVVGFDFSTQLCIDIHLPNLLGSTIYTPPMQRMVLGQLAISNQDDGPTGECAISGHVGPLLKSKLPLWKGAPIFDSPPYAKFKAAPCNQRYGRFELDGFDISADLARQLVGGLNAQTVADKEWKTWVKLPNGKFKKQAGKKPLPLSDLMLAYPSFDVEDLVTVDVFVQPRFDGSPGAKDQAKVFVDCAERLLLRLKEKSSVDSDEPNYMHVVLVQKLNQGQVQLSYSATPTVKDFIAAVEAWSRSGDNLPKNLQIPLPSKKSANGFRRRTPRLLFPEEISRLLTHQWTRDGSESTTIQGPSVGMVLDLFLRKQGVWEASAMRLLELTLIRSDALLVGAGHILHRDGPASIVNWTKFVAKAQSGRIKKQPDYALAQTLSLLGSLLYIMNSTVQTYTYESAYLVGKLLAMMDELHRCYCVAERKGDIPNSLIGNSLLGRAADSPVMALAELCERGRIYMGWAKTASVRDGADDGHQIAVNSARKLLRLAQPIAEQLHVSDDLAVELSAVRKAHLFLGYLSPTLVIPMSFQDESNYGIF